MPGQAWQPRLLCRNRIFLSCICVPIELLATFLISVALLDLSPLDSLSALFFSCVQSIVIFLVYVLVLMQVIWWSFAQENVFDSKRAMLRTPSNSTSTLTPARRILSPIYIITSLDTAECGWEW
jgi:hypothetical protein